MRIFSRHRKKMEPKRRFGSMQFRNKIKSAANYKRILPKQLNWKFWRNVGIIGLAVIVYYICISSRFVISNFVIHGNSQVTTQQIVDALGSEGDNRLFLIKKSSFFIMTQGLANSMLTNKIPTIKEISDYRRIWPNRVEFTVKERTPGFIIKSNDSFFLVDDEGVVVKAVDGPSDLLVAEDSVVESFGTGESLPNAKLAAFIISASRGWPEKINTPITGVKFPGKASNEVQFTSLEGWTVFFDINRSVTSELNDLNVILAKSIAPQDRSKLVYIDLRLDKLIYYCFKQSACSSQPQPEPETLEPTK